MTDQPDQDCPLPSPGRALPDTVNLPPSAPAAPAGPTATGRDCGPYELLGEIQRGGMGVVYRARERHSGRLVALKMMLPESATRELRRFILEARATGELHHPGIVAIHSWGEHQGCPYYAMDFVPGVTLDRVLLEGPLTCERAVRYLLGMARAVAAAHALGIVHRDLKPGNVIIDLSDQPRVLDFGLAKRQTDPPSPRPSPQPIPEVLPVEVVPLETTASPANQTRESPRTEIGAILGTPSYMAPEQVRAEHDRVGPPADVHALGAIFYEMLGGRPPFQSESTYQTLLQVLHEEPVPLRQRNRHVPAALEELCDRCLAKDRAMRYPNAGALAEDLELRWGRSVRAARFARLTLRAGLALLLLATLQFLYEGWLAPIVEEVLHALLRGAHTSEPVQHVAFTLAHVLEVVCLVVAPYLAEIGLLVWMSVWLWNAERAPQVALVFGAFAFAGLLLSFGPMLAFLGSAPLFLAWLLTLDALLALGLVLYRAGSRAPRRVPRDSRSGPSEPYLQKLFAVRVEARPRAAARPREEPALGLADFELGKTLFRWDDHEVRWARQKSLDRAVLVWLDHHRSAAGEARVPGIVVRHPAVLALFAVGSTPDGSFLVTEPATASPLGEVLAQRGHLSVLEVAALGAQLARAVQAFHAQGVCHGRLRPDWLLVRGDLEPVLCPCGFPSQAPEDRQQDVEALGQLLLQWLPPWRRRWGEWLFGPVYLAPLYEIAGAASAGNYRRAEDLAHDLDRAAREVHLSWRAGWIKLLILVLLLLPACGVIVYGLLGRSGMVDPEEWSALGLSSRSGLAGYLLLSLSPSVVLLGYTHGRRLARAWSEASSPVAKRRRWLGPLQLVQGVFFLIVISGLAWFNLQADHTGVGALLASWFVLLAEIGGFWLVGACAACLVTFLELLGRSLKPVPSDSGEIS
jgi:serine/threonine protein kinase